MKILIRQNVPLAQFTTFRIGGAAKFFCEVKNEEEISEALNYAKENELKIFILGGGSNLLISDDGFDGLVIRMQNTACQVLNEKIECGAGINLSEVVNLATKESLTGLEWAAGIPGTIGGAIRGNAGTPLGCMSDAIVEVRVMDKLNDKYQTKNYKLQECEFAYRESVFKKKSQLAICSCVLKLEKGQKEEIENKIKEVIEKRSKAIHPNPKEPSSGSFFKNPKVDNAELIARFEKETGQKTCDSKIPAGWLIDEVGLRGKKIGQVMISQEHANFLVNLGGAKAQDVVILASFVKMKVRDELGVELKEEVQYVGF